MRVGQRPERVQSIEMNFEAIGSEQFGVIAAVAQLQKLNRALDVENSAATGLEVVMRRGFVREFNFHALTDAVNLGTQLRRQLALKYLHAKSLEARDEIGLADDRPRAQQRLALPDLSAAAMVSLEGRKGGNQHALVSGRPQASVDLVASPFRSRGLQRRDETLCETHEVVLCLGGVGGIGIVAVEDEDDVEITSVPEFVARELSHPDDQEVTAMNGFGNTVGKVFDPGSRQAESGPHATLCDVGKREFDLSPVDPATEIEETGIEYLSIHEEPQGVETPFDINWPHWEAPALPYRVRRPH